MRNICLYLLLLLLPTFVAAADGNDQTFTRQNGVVVAHAASTSQDHQAIRQTLLHYLQGTSYNRQGQISQAFHPQADLLLAKANQPFGKCS